jgi:hypothetical protein
MFEIVFASKTHPHVLTVWIKGTDAPKFEQYTDERVAEAAVKVLRQYFKNSTISVPKIMR